jgi:hypothetical protein
MLGTERRCEPDLASWPEPRRSLIAISCQLERCWRGFLGWRVFFISGRQPQDIRSAVGSARISSAWEPRFKGMAPIGISPAFSPGMSTRAIRNAVCGQRAAHSILSAGVADITGLAVAGWSAASWAHHAFSFARLLPRTGRIAASALPLVIPPRAAVTKLDSSSDPPCERATR